MVQDRCHDNVGITFLSAARMVVRVVVVVVVVMLVVVMRGQASQATAVIVLSTFIASAKFEVFSVAQVRSLRVSLSC